MTYTIIEYGFSQHRSAQYAKASSAVDAEVLFAGREAPGDSSYTWDHLPNRSDLALRTALDYSRSDVWIVVEPNVRQLAGICRLARRKSVKVEVWLDESQNRVWMGATVFRAVGFQIETKYTHQGLAAFVHIGTHAGDESSKGKRLDNAA